MAYALEQGVTASFNPGADLSLNQFQFVKLGTDGNVYPMDSTSFAFGVLNNVPSAGATGQYSATVQLSGVCRLAVAGAYSAGTYLVPTITADGTGLGLSAALNTGAIGRVAALQLQPSTAAGDIVAVKLISESPGLDTTSL